MDEAMIIQGYIEDWNSDEESDEDDDDEEEDNVDES